MPAIGILTLVFLAGMSSTAFAQQHHAVDPSTISQIVAEQVETQDADRAAVRDALARPEVVSVASRMGFDLKTIEASVQTLSGAELQQAASAARQVNDSLVGGASTIVISTTAIIIVLLLVLIIVVAV